ncbi:MAG: hypothetical protein ABR514_04275 [Chthoniobacterales bacterium]
MFRDSSQNGDSLEAAIQLLKQERRFFRQQQPTLATATDTDTLDRHLEQYQQEILRQSTRHNELGLYRNASLVLGCLAIARDDYDAALDHLLDVAFLDIVGATNSLPGHRSFDASLSLLVPFVSGILRDICRTLDLHPDETESFFRARWGRFSSFGTPPVEPDSAWRTLDAAIRI